MNAYTLLRVTTGDLISLWRMGGKLRHVRNQLILKLLRNVEKVDVRGEGEGTLTQRVYAEWGGEELHAYT